MPSLTARLGSGSERGNELRWALAGIAVVLVLIAAIGAVYVTGTTPERTYSADLTDAGNVRPGDDVRVAGIPIGKVKSLTLLPDRVRMTFTVADKVFVGDQTTLGIRMLTIVGGYYVAVDPAGTRALGSAVIPEQRVVLPYDLTQAFQDAIEPVRHTDGDTIRQDLAALSTSIDKSPDSLRGAIQAVGDLVGIMNRQNADISHTLSLADEYLTALNKNSDVLVRLVTTLGTLETIVQNNKAQLSYALHGLASVLHQLTPLGRAWDETLKQRAQPLADAIPQLQQLGTRLDTLLDSLRTLEQRLLPFMQPGGGVSVDQSATTISGICVPVPGGGC